MQTEVSLSADHATKLYQAINNIPREYDQEKQPQELEQIVGEILLNMLPENVLSMIHLFREKNHLPYMLFRNFISLPDLPATPTNDISPATRGWRHPAAALLGLLHLAGCSARSFKDEMEGRLCHMVMPAKNSDKSYSRSTKKLGFHTEVVNGHFTEEHPRYGQPISPEVFGLVGLRNPSHVPTTLLQLNNILHNLSPATLNELMQPHFIAHSQSSFDRNITIENISVIQKINNEILGIRYSHSKLQALGHDAEKALSTLGDVINNSDKIEYVALNPGDVMIINNRTCLHGRSSISDTAKFDGLDRWLVRIYGYRNETLSALKCDSVNKHIILVE